MEEERAWKDPEKCFQLFMREYNRKMRNEDKGVETVSVRNEKNGKTTIGHAENVEIKSKNEKISVGPTPGTIGANPTIWLKIKVLFNKVCEERKKYIKNTKNPYAVLAGQLKNHFKVKHLTWEQWTKFQDESKSKEILEWLSEKYDNTAQGRINKSRKKQKI
jgi:hypothetical protein